MNLAPENQTAAYFQQWNLKKCARAYGVGALDLVEEREIIIGRPMAMSLSQRDGTSSRFETAVK